MNHMSRRIPFAQRGFTLIELMVALVLGLLVIGAAGSIFLSNRRVYGSTEAINRIQENQRSAFELLSRDIREAGANPCQRFTATNRPVIQMTAPNATFWSRFPDGLFGVDGTGAGGADSITLYSGNSTQYNVTQHKVPTDPITVNNKTTGLINGQALMVCNTDYAIVFSATGITPGGTTIGHDGTGNCGKGLTPSPDPAQCAAANSGPGYCFQVPGVPPATPSASDTTNCPKGIGQSPAFVLVPFDATWTVEANSRGNSLYRTFGGAKSEIAEGITALHLTYRIGSATDYKSAADVTTANAWSLVTAVHLSMTFQSVQGAMAQGDTKGTDNAVLTRSLDDYIALRNHQDVQ